MIRSGLTAQVSKEGTGRTVEENSEKDYPLLFTLTELTGKKSKDERTMIVQGFEFPRRYGLIAILAFLPAIFGGLAFLPFFGPAGAFVVGLAVMGVFFVGFESRSRRGLKLKMYQTVYDKSQNQIRKLNGHVIRCGQVVEDLAENPGYIRMSAEDARKPDPESELEVKDAIDDVEDDLFGGFDDHSDSGRRETRPDMGLTRVRTEDSTTTTTSTGPTLVYDD